MITRRQQFKRVIKWMAVLFFLRLILLTLFNRYFGKPLLELCLADLESSSTLAEKVACLRDHRCPQWGNPYTNVSHLLVCNSEIDGTQNQDGGIELLLMTTMYAKENMFIFNNTLHVWRSLGKRHAKVQPVLFIDSMESFIEENKTDFLHRACQMGWTVAMAPLCNQHQFPVFKQLFVAAMARWNATWYGYANGDMLFDDSLLESLDFLTRHKEIFKTSMVVGRRYDLRLKVNQTVHKSEISQKFPDTRMADAAMVDYFLTMRHTFPWNDIPEFVIGRPGYDTWLVWLINALKMKVVDTTTSIRAVHQVIEGLNEDQNSHKTHKEGAGMLYNEDLSLRLSKTRNLRLVRGLGYLSCVPHKLTKISKVLLKKIVAEATGPLIEVIGRGQEVLPMKGFEALVKNTNTGEKPMMNNSLEENTQIKTVNDTATKSPTARKLLALNKNNTHHRIASEKAFLLMDTNQKLQMQRKAKEVQRIMTRNSTANKNQTKQAKTKRDVEPHTKPPTPVNWYALSPKRPVAYIPDSTDFQYVLIKKTKYFKLLENDKGFRQVFQNLHGACYNNQHIDLELGDLVIY